MEMPCMHCQVLPFCIICMHVGLPMSLMPLQDIAHAKVYLIRNEVLTEHQVAEQQATAAQHTAHVPLSGMQNMLLQLVAGKKLLLWDFVFAECRLAPPLLLRLPSEAQTQAVELEK